jgi:proline dehydrogenase
MSPLKDLFLYLSKSSIIQKFLSTSGPCKIIPRRFISGETLSVGIIIARELNKQGFLVTLDNLGESVTNKDQAISATQEYLNIIRAISTPPNPDVIPKEATSFGTITSSLKLTQLGLALEYQLCLENIREIMQEAKKSNNRVTIDMEDSPYTERTLNIYKTLLKEGFSTLGIVIQSYLKRSESDIRNLVPLGPRVRLCKGAYKEPSTIAFARKKDVDKNYLHLLSILFSKDALEKGAYPEVATHDEKIINWTSALVKKNNIPAEQFEFQMLYGIRRDLQQRLVKQGYRTRVYLPYGTHWYPYFMRRLAERPANLWFILKNLCYR